MLYSFDVKAKLVTIEQLLLQKNKDFYKKLKDARFFNVLFLLLNTHRVDLTRFFVAKIKRK